MEPFVNEWLSLALRWFHLVAGISWIGNSFYFMWLDSHLRPLDKPNTRIEGELWLVHSGGFYRIEKRKIGPGEMPKVLHWFKWEATLTWISGFFLLGLVYYMTNGVYLLKGGDDGLSMGVATSIGIGLLVVSWFVYDLLWQSRLSNNSLAAASFLILGLIIYGLCQIFSGRGAFIHVGALLGSLMVMNVWMRILPAQKEMIAATKNGRNPDFTLGKKAKRRSTHNSYMTLPVLFIMISNHYPMTYSGDLNWLMLILMILVGGGIRYFMLKTKYWIFIPVFVGLSAVIYLSLPSSPSKSVAVSSKVTIDQVESIIKNRCQTCHSIHPSDDLFTVAPLGFLLDSQEQIIMGAEKIHARSVSTLTMPPANITKMTDEERAILGQWFSQGVKK